MEKHRIDLFDLWPETMRVLNAEGLLLCSIGANHEHNMMPISWMTGGQLWGKPMLTVLVRPSRFTASLLEQVGEFTVNVLPMELRGAVEWCGEVSGRHEDKFKRTSLTPVRARAVRPPVIAEGVVHYECRVVHKNDVVSEHLVPELRAHGDSHRFYFGEVVASYASPDARHRLERIELPSI